MHDISPPVYENSFENILVDKHVFPSCSYLLRQCSVPSTEVTLGMKHYSRNALSESSICSLYHSGSPHIVFSKYEDNFETCTDFTEYRATQQ